MEVNDVIAKIKQYAKEINDGEFGDANRDVILSSEQEKARTIEKVKADKEISEYFSANKQEMSDANIFGLLNLDLSSSSAHEENNSNQSPVSKAERKGTSTDVRIMISEIVARTSAKNINWADVSRILMEIIEDPNIQFTNREEYKKYAKAAREVASTVNILKLDSKADIDKASKMAFGFSTEDGLYDYRQEVLKDMIGLAKNHQIAKEYAVVKQEFGDLIEAVPVEAALVKVLSSDSKYSDLLQKYKNEEIQHDAVVSQLDDSAKAYFERLTKKYSREDAVKYIKSQYKGSYSKEAIEQLEKSDVLEHARMEVLDNIYALKGRSDLTTSKAIEDEMKKHITIDEYTKRIMSGELTFKQKVRGDRSDYKNFRKAIATYNRVENIKSKTYSKEELYKLFKGKQRFNQLVRTTLKQLIVETPPGSGKYDISKLSDLIKEQISPADMRANYSDTASISEIQSVINAVSRDSGVEISYKEACNMIDFCGFERDKKDVAFVLSVLGKTVKDTAVGFATAAVASHLTKAVAGAVDADVEAVAHVTNNFAAVTATLLGQTVGVAIDPDNPVEINLRYKIDVNVNGEPVDADYDVNRLDVLRQLKSAGLEKGQYGFQKESDGSWYLWIKKPSDEPYEDMRQLSTILGENFDLEKDMGLKAEGTAEITKKDIHQEDPKVSRKNAILYGTLINLGINGLINALTTAQKCEKSFFPTTVTAKTLDAYEREISAIPEIKANPRIKEAIMNIASLPAFYKTENGQEAWDKNKFEDFLQEIAGGISVLNRTELLNGLFMYKKEHDLSLKMKENQQVQQQQQNTENAEPENGTKYTLSDPSTNIDDNVKTIHNAGKYGWENLGKMYASEDGTQCFENKIAFRAMQIIQAIDPEAVEGKYDADAIRAIVAKAFPNGRGKPNWNYINNQLKNEYPMVDVARLKAVLGSPVSADETKEKKVVAPLQLYDSSTGRLYNRGTPQVEAKVKTEDLDKTNKQRFNVATKFKTVKNGQVHYWLKPPGGEATEVGQEVWNNSKYTVKQPE